jgi:glycerol-3-phosphate dehydrogenase (NAD+)
MSEAENKKVISIIGSGNWGSCIAKIVGNNLQHNNLYKNELKMWVFEELINGRKLTEIINEDHENVKYLPGAILPNNVIAIPDLLQAAKDADILVFVLPHQFLPRVLSQLKGHVKSTALGVTLIKGLDTGDENGGIRLISDAIREKLNIRCAALMGANLAPEVSRELYCEATIGCKSKELGDELKSLFQTDYFRIVVVTDEVGVELCGALKNVVACGAGFAEGLGYGENTKAAIIRLGFMEMIKFIKEFYSDRGIKQATFLESCGVADLITTCYGGRNRKVAIEFAKTGKSIATLEKELLNGQSAQGPLTAREVNAMLKIKKAEIEYPLFTAIYNICEGHVKVESFIDCLRNHPEHM